MYIYIYDEDKNKRNMIDYIPGQLWPILSYTVSFYILFYIYYTYLRALEEVMEEEVGANIHSSHPRASG